MAARRAAAAAAAASPAGLKIKVKVGVGAAAKASKEGEGGEDGDGNARMLKRKRLTPPGSPAVVVNKRPPRGESLHSTANGEPAEPVPKKLASNSTAKPDVVAKPETGTTESLEQPKLDGGIKACSNSQAGVTTTAADHHTSAAQKAADADPSGAQPQSVPVSSSLATSSVTTPAEETRHHTIPSHAGWFSWTEIHTLEKRGLPEFFSGKVPGKTPELYMEYRNTIMKKYREHLGTVITVPDVQEQLSGVDEKSIHRIMEFLDHWGLVNYNAPAEFLPSWKHCSPVLESDATLMLRALPRKGSSLYHFDSTTCGATTPVFQQSPVKPKTTDAAVIAEMLAFGEGAEVDYHCNSCSADCSKQRYHCQKQADFDLCPDCYNEGLFGPDMMSADFIKMDVTEVSNANGGGWTDQETLLLLEALELYGDNWNEIAEHVATKSKSQCILHFIRLPVEDPFSEDAAADNPASTLISQTDSALEGDQHEEKETAEKKTAEDDDTTNVVKSTDNKAAAAVEPRNGDLVMPPNLAAFAEAGNPVMAQMAFLATMIGSKLGGEAAQAALATLTTKDPGVHLAAGTAMILEDPVVGVADVEQPSTSQHPDRSVPADEEMQSGDETTATAGDAGPRPPAAGVKLPVAAADSPAAAQKDDNDAPTQQEPPSLGKEIVQKPDAAAESLNVLEEAKVAGRVKRAAASAMAAAAVKAKLLADQEEREMQRLIALVTEQQLKKLELKLKFLNELDGAIGKGCEAVDRDRVNFFTDYARIASQHLSGSLNLNPPPSPPRQQQQQQQQQQQSLVLAQAPAPSASFQGQQQLYGHGHGFQPMAHLSAAGIGNSNNHQLPNHAAFVQQQMQQQMYQGLANSMNAGAMTMQQQGHFQRHMMIAGTAGTHMLGRSVGPPELLTPPPPVMMRRPATAETAGQGVLGGPLPGMPGLARPVPGGMPQ